MKTSQEQNNGNNFLRESAKRLAEVILGDLAAENEMVDKENFVRSHLKLKKYYLSFESLEAYLDESHSTADEVHNLFQSIFDQ